MSTNKPNFLFPYYGMRVAPMSYSQQTGYFHAVSRSRSPDRSPRRSIETAALQRDNASTGARFMTDEYQFAPYRTKVAVGTTVTWRNDGRMVRSAVAEDGSWSAGPIDPAGVAAATSDRQGTFVYACKEHPWAYAQIMVE